MNPPKPFEPREARVRAYRWWLAGPFAAFFLASMEWLARPGAMDSLSGLMVYAALVGLTGASMALLVGWRRLVSGRLTVDADGVYLGARRIARLSRVRQAVAYPAKEGAGVRMWQRFHGAAVDVELGSEDAAQELLEALSTDARQTTAAFSVVRGGAAEEMRTVRSAMVLTAVALATMFVVMVERHHDFDHLAPAPGIASILTALVVWFGFYVRLMRRAGRAEVRLVVGADGLLATACVDARPATSVLARVAEARAAYTARGAPADLASLLARGDRDVRAWRAAPRSLLGDARTYRTAAVPPEMLWRVLEDPTQPEAARAGAAVAR